MFDQVLTSLGLTLRELEILRYRFGISREEAHTRQQVLEVFHVHPNELLELEHRVLKILNNDEFKNERDLIRSSACNNSLNIFISYAREDIKFAQSLHRYLLQHDCNPWVDYINLQGGIEWSEEVTEAISKSDVFISCFSNSSVTKRGFVQKELNLALDISETIPEGNVYIIPLQIDDCQIPKKLSKYHVIRCAEANLNKLMITLCCQAKRLGKSIPSVRDYSTDSGIPLEKNIMDAINIIIGLEERPHLLVSLDRINKGSLPSNIPKEYILDDIQATVFDVSPASALNLVIEHSLIKFTIPERSDFKEAKVEIPVGAIVAIASEESKHRYYDSVKIDEQWLEDTR